MANLTHFLTLSSLSSRKLYSSARPSFGANVHPPRKEHFTVWAFSLDKPRRSRKVKSNAELCNDLREFVSIVGLPEGHIPSMKELSEHGRKDLANIVRRRGYKLIGELLGNRTKVNEISDLETTYSEVTGQDEKVNSLKADSVPSEMPITENIFTNATTDSTGISVEPSINSSLQEKVAKFIQSGELDAAAGHEEGMGATETKDSVETELISLHKESLEHNPSGCSTRTILNGSTFKPVGDDHLPAEGLTGADADKVLDVETRKRENQAEITKLKLMLHQKELELSRLKEQIQKEKLSLSNLQMKAEAEINKAQKLISEKDAELQAAEESLLGLKEVKIQYRGEGEIVEVTGSFNGWDPDHRIGMDPQPSSGITDPIGSRKSRLWSTTLWLYPGTYEIKFIVDGEWRIDPERELVTRGTIHNNILRVDR